jgi:TRAP-type transport system small permease protein
MRAFNRVVYRVLQIAVTVLLAVLLVPVTMQILSRYTELVPRYIWTEEVARFCLIWTVMIGAMIAIREETHFDLDILPKAKTARGQALGRLVAHGAMLVTALVFLIYGWPFAQFGWDQNSELTEINMLWIYGAWPLFGLVGTLFLGEMLYDDVQAYRSGAPADAAAAAASPLPGDAE